MVVEGPSLPPDVLLVREGLDPEVVDEIRTTFEENFEALLASMLEGKDNAKYEDAELVVVDDGDYDVVRSMYEAIGVSDFSEFVGD
jgi:phosphonate transport system substrate-binding protein